MDGRTDLGQMRPTHFIESLKWVYLFRFTTIMGDVSS